MCDHLITHERIAEAERDMHMALPLLHAWLDGNHAGFPTATPPGWPAVLAFHGMASSELSFEGFKQMQHAITGVPSC